MSARSSCAIMAALLVVSAVYAVKDVIGGTIYLIDEPYDAYMRLFAMSRLILIALAALIACKPVLSRSDRLLFGGIVGLSLDVYWQYVPTGSFLFWFSAALGNGAIGYGIAQLVRYAAEDHPSPTFKRRASIWAVAIGVTIAVAGFSIIALGYVSIGSWRVDDAAFAAVAPWLDRLRWLAMLAGCAAIEAFAVASLRRTQPERHAHALLVVASFAPLALATSVHALVRIAGAHDLAAARDVDALGNVVTAAGLAYGALSRRLVDVEFYVSAALAATIAGAALTLLGFLGEHFFVPWVAESVERLPVFARYGPAMQIGAQLVTAFAAYLVLTKVYDEAAPRVRNAIFHHREEHLAALREFAETVTTLSVGEVAPALIEIVERHVWATFAGLYRRSGRDFSLLEGAGEPAPALRLAHDNPRVPATLKPHVNEDGSAAFAMPQNERIAGFLLAGPKRDTTAYAPDELRALALAVRETGIALSRITRKSP
ncbi:MAG TPA: hypothetical protein VGG51_05240 [Candidatus Cybelea sp.]